MFADQLRGAVEASPRMKLPELTALLWRALAEGQVTEAEAEALSERIEARKAIPARPTPARTGSRPRTDASMERRRRWAASGALPMALAARFTLAEQAALAVVGDAVAVRGDCRMSVGEIAARAGVSETTVRNAIREARRLGLVAVEERRVTFWRNLPNVVRIVSAEWRQWLKRDGWGGRVQNRAGLGHPVERSVAVEAEGSGSKGYRHGESWDRLTSPWIPSGMRWEGRTGRQGSRRSPGAGRS